MAMLNFKYGLYRDPNTNAVKLPETINNGTIYVTTDEKAMYVDLNNERIRLGQIVTCTKEEWEKLQPPYSTEAFYYIIGENALLKYNAEDTGDDGYTAGWVQINSTAALESRIKVLEDADYTGKITGINGRLDALETADDSIGANIDEIEGLINYKGKIDTLPTSGVSVGDVYLVSTEYKRCNSISENGTPTWETTSGVNSELINLKTRVNILENTTATDAAIESLNERVGIPADEAEGVEATGLYLKTDEIAADVKSNTEKLAGILDGKDIDSFADVESELKKYQLTGNYATKEEAQGYANAVLGESGDSENSNTVYGAKAAAEKAQQTINDYITSNEGKLAGILNSKSIDSFADVEGALNKKQDIITDGTYDAYGSAAAVKEELIGKKGDSADLNTINGAKTMASAAQAAAEAAKLYAETTVLGDVEDTAEEKTVYGAFAAITGLRNEITSDMQVADAMVFKDTVEKANDLPTVGSTDASGNKLSAGWTYKATAEFTLTQGEDEIQVYIGDLLIASGTEDDDGSLTSVNWKHVPSGYVADYNPEMTVTGATNSAVIKLLSGVAKDDEENTEDLGKFILTTNANSALTLTTSADTITISMAWGEF